LACASASRSCAAGAIAFGALLAIAAFADPLAGKAPSSLVLDRDGAPLTLLASESGAFRLWVPLEEYPQLLVDVLLFKEDKRFFSHAGVDFPALARAASAALGVRARSGGSTIDMQLQRVAFSLSTDHPAGKLAQAFRALALSARLSRRAALELYLNLAPCGGNVEGFGTASWVWFGKRPADLNASEILALASLPQDPTGRNPATERGRAALGAARDRLRARWEEAGRPALGADAADGSDPATERRVPFRAPQFSRWCIDSARAAGSVSVVRSTLSLPLQETVERMVRRYIERRREFGVRNASAILMDAETGDVLAYVGSADFFDESIDGQVDGPAARRSPGSTVKPFIYALALDQGLAHPYTMLPDVKTAFGAYRPDNFDDSFDGPVRAVDALNRSRNVPAVLLASRLSNPDLYGFLTGLGGAALPHGRDHYGLSLVLGAAELTGRELAGLYSAFWSSGVMAEARCLADGPSVRRRLFSDEAAWIVRWMLEDGEARAGYRNPAIVRRGGPIAYKTGTSIGFRDAWSAGVFDGVVLVTWVGEFSSGGNPEFVGGRSAAPLMMEIADALRSGDAFAPWAARESPAAPEGIAYVEVCADSGDVPNGLCPYLARCPVIAGVSPIKACEVHRLVHVDPATGYRRAYAIPGVTVEDIREVWPDDLAAVFERAGIERNAPPPYDPADAGLVGRDQGAAPSIVYPAAASRYLISASPADARIPFVANSSSDARTLFWFVNGAFVGSVRAGDPFFWEAAPGRVSLTVADDLGRSSTIEFEVSP
jgi:penicillin-binding protein 1C